MPSHQSDDIVCFEVGSNAPPSVVSVHTLGDDWRALEIHAQRGVIELSVRGDQVSIFGMTRVGLVLLPSGRRLIVRSKISSIALLEWLAYLGEFPQLTAWLPEAGVRIGDEWHQCIARLFLYALEHVTRRHLRKDYLALSSDEPQIRGRIVTTLLAQRLYRLPKVPQIQRRRTLDTPFNRVLALALDRVPLLLTDSRAEDLRRLAGLRDQWAWIDRSVDDPASAVAAAQWASPPGYREALQLARLILIGAALDPASHVGGQVFLLSLAGIWERAVRRMFDQLAHETGWQRVADSQRTRRWDDPVGQYDPSRWLIADVVAERAGLRWVVDAKYKRDFGDESRADRFQMCAYALAFDADRVSLVYPTGTGPSTSSRVLLHAAVGGKMLCVDSLALPMAAGPEACCAALAANANEILGFHDDGSALAGKMRSDT